MLSNFVKVLLFRNSKIIYGLKDHTFLKDKVLQL